MLNIKVSYESYRCICYKELKIFFGYPRTATCNTCDTLIAKSANVNSQILAQSADDKLMVDKKELIKEHELHKRKSETFYERKGNARKKTATNDQIVALTFDFQKNLYVPNKSTNDAYYRGCYSFNINVLITREAHFYCYDKTVFFFIFFSVYRLLLVAFDTFLFLL